MKVGIEAINFYGGTAFLDVYKLAEYRKLDLKRFENLLMKERSIPMPYEDPISLAVNAAKPIIDELSEENKKKIKMVITCSESGIDFGKSMSTYIHYHLGLDRNCRLFELKNACYSGTAGLQMAINFVASNASPGGKVLVIATDMARFIEAEPGEALTADWSFAEPSGGSGAVAMLVSDKPNVFQVDFGANGYYGYEIMDTCRPIPDSEAGDSDKSLLSYMDCCQASYSEYKKIVRNVDFKNSFQYLVFHTPFGGMAKGAHRKLMRMECRSMDAKAVESDFQNRVMPGLDYCQRVGNIMGATIFLALLSVICNGNYDSPKRIGCFSYGSGCCSEFYSGVVTKKGQDLVKNMNIKKGLDRRFELSMEQYESILMGNGAIKFGTRNIKVNKDIVPETLKIERDRKILILDEIKEFHREYIWI